MKHKDLGDHELNLIQRLVRVTIEVIETHVFGYIEENDGGERGCNRNQIPRDSYSCNFLRGYK